MGNEIFAFPKSVNEAVNPAVERGVQEGIPQGQTRLKRSGETLARFFDRV